MLRTAHGWIGLWGALFGLLIGVTGFVLNHRAILALPIERGERAIVEVELPVTPNTLEALRVAVAAQIGFDARSAPSSSKIEPARDVRWGGRVVRQPERWQLVLASPRRQAQVDYLVGNRFASVERYEANALGTLTRLHQSAGVNAAWVLLMDSIAGSFVFLAVSGFLLWTQLRAPRLAGAAVLLAPVAIGAIVLIRIAD